MDVGALFRPNLATTTTADSQRINWLGKLYENEMSVCAYRKTGTCIPLNDIQNGKVQPGVCKSKFIITGTRCKYVCESGYRLTGYATTICLQNGRWSSTPPMCSGRNICPTLTSNVHLIKPLKCLNGIVAEGQVCKISCSSNYLLQGNARITCHSDGSWSGNLPDCNVVCPALRPPNVGSIFPQQCEKGNLPVNFVCTSDCMINRKLLGTVDRACLSDGTWEGQQTVCERYCPPLKNLSNGKIIPMQCITNSSSSGEVCDMRCDVGFFLIGKSRIACVNGMWLGTVASCDQDYCNRIIGNQLTEKLSYYGLINAAVVPSSLVTINCNPGSRTTTSPQRVCLQTGEWSSGTETCNEVRCNSLTKLYNGIVSPRDCVESRNGIRVGMVCFFSCKTGYVLKGISSKECLIGGQWSFSYIKVACLDTIPVPYASTFNIQLFEELSIRETRNRCLQSSMDSAAVFFEQCDRSNFYQRWKWLGSTHLQSIGSQMCLDLQSEIHSIHS